MDSQHRKIELQSPQDLAFIQSQIRNLALQKLNLHLPSVTSTSNSAPEPDDLRRKTEELVNVFVAQVLAGMRHNISINGNDVMPASLEDDASTEAPMLEVEEFEPYDEKTRARLAELNIKRDALISKISAHRRETPGLAAERYRLGFEKEMQDLERLREEGVKRAGAVDEKDVIVVEELKRAEEVRRNWERTVEGLGRLEKELPETRARLERCGEVVGYLNGDGNAVRRS